MASDTFVLVHRLELAKDGGRPCEAVPFLFEDEEDAIPFAISLMRDTACQWDWPPEDQDVEAEALEHDLADVPRTAPAANMHAEHRVHLSDGDDEVFELYRRGIAPKGHLYPEAGR